MSCSRLPCNPIIKALRSLASELHGHLDNWTETVRNSTVHQLRKKKHPQKITFKSLWKNKLAPRTRNRTTCECWLQPCALEDVKEEPNTIWSPLCIRAVPIELRISCSLQSGSDAQNFPAPHWLSSPASAQRKVHGLSKAWWFKLSKLEEAFFASTAFARWVFGEPGHSTGRGLEFWELRSTELERWTWTAHLAAPLRLHVKEERAIYN